MNRIQLLALMFPLSLLPLPGSATPALEIEFIHADAYTDANLRRANRHDCDYVCKELHAHLTVLAARYLAAGQMLRIEVRDIDLAGRFEPWRINAYDVRYLKEVAWPHINLRYALTENGRVLAGGEETLTDQLYLNQNNPYTDRNDLRFERRMLDEWFRQRFSANGATGASSH